MQGKAISRGLSLYCKKANLKGNNIFVLFYFMLFHDSRLGGLSWSCQQLVLQGKAPQKCIDTILVLGY